MRRLLSARAVSIGLVSALLSAGLVSQGIITAAAAPAPAQLVLSVVGDGSTALAGTPTAVSLVTVNADASASSVPVVQLPVAASGADLPFTLSGDSSAIGQLALAGNAGSLAIAGYGATPGQFATDPKDSLASVAPRIVASISPTGAVDTSTVLTGAFSEDHPRSVATADGSAFYISGNGGKKTPAAGVVLAQRGSTAPPAAITDVPINARNLAISDGRLFASSGAKTTLGVYAIGGSPLPTTSTAGTRIITAPSGTPGSFVLLDRDPSVAGDDTAYLVIEELGIYKFSLTDGGWTARGSIAGDFQAVTATTADSAAQLYAISLTSAGNSLVAITDSAAAAATLAPTAPITVATAAPNTAFRGVALAPTGWAPDAGDPVDGVPTPTATVTPAALTTVVGAAPVSASLELESGGGSDPATFSVTAATNTGAVATVTGTGATRTVTVTPIAVGITTVTLTITDPNAATPGTATLTVGASVATPGLTDVVYHQGSADASTAIDVGGDHMLVADDESNTIRLYSRTTDGAPVKEFDFSQYLGSKEVDLEASVRIGDTIYWFASHGNNKSSEYKAARSILFSTTVTGVGAATELTYGGQYTGLRADLLAWDAANGNRLALNTACSLAGGTHPDETTGCNIEGVDVATDGTTALVAFRAPRVGGAGLVVPVKNLASLIGADAGAATFGEPMLLDLGGRTLRELRGNGEGEYLITAGVPDDETAALGWALYRWNGVGSSAPILVAMLPGTGAVGQESGSYESIVAVPSVFGAGSRIQLLTDNGTTVFYGDGVEGKDVSPAALLKFRSNVVTLGSIEAPAATVSASSVAAGGSLDVSAGGFTPGETAEIWVYSDPVRVASVVVPASGIVSARIAIPASVDAGSHQVRVTGLGSGLVRSAALSVTAAASAAAGSVTALAQTGVNSGNAGPLGLLLLALGAVLVLRRRASGRESGGVARRAPVEAARGAASRG